MKLFSLIGMVCGLVLSCMLPVAFGQTGEARLSSDPGVGATSFRQYCSPCHGLDGRGNGPVAQALQTPPADLTRIAQRRGGQFPEADIAAYIDGRTDVRAHGSRAMPVWGQRFSDSFGGDTVAEEAARGNILVLLNYLKSIQQP